MSNFYEDASVVMVPSGYKDQKVYSSVPDDGSADLTFSRGSDIEATRVAANGYIEKAKVNLLLGSNDFGGIYYSFITASVTSGQSGYDGTSDAYRLDISDASGRISQPIVASGVLTGSIYAKAGTLNWIRLLLTGSSTDDRYYNLSNGTLGGTTYSGGIDSTIEAVGSGWYRISFTNSDTTATIRFYPAQADGDLTATSGNIYIQDAQLNYGLVAQEYQETTTTTVVTGITNDLPRLNYSGGASCPSLLLEGQRRNLITQSEFFGASDWGLLGATLEVNSATSPEGVSNAYKITDDTSTGYHRVTTSNIFTADGVMRTWSLYVKQGTARYCAISNSSVFSSTVNTLIFDMQEGVYTAEGTTDYFDIVHDPIDMGNGWWRIGFSSDINSGSYDNFLIGISQGALWSGNLSYTGDGSLNFYIYGAQCEDNGSGGAASYPSSIIPCYGTSATRTADACSKTGISSLIGQTAGSFYAEIEAFYDDGTNRVLSLSDGTSSNRVLLLYQADSNKMRAQLSVSGQSSITIDSIQDTTQKRKLACAWDSTSFVFYIDGVKIGETSTGYTFSDTLSALRFDNVSGGFFYGEMSGLLLFTSKLSNSDLAALTA